MPNQNSSSIQGSNLRSNTSFSSVLFAGAILIALLAFFYAQRDRTAPPERHESKEFLRAGLPGFEQYRRLINVEGLKATQTSRASGDTVMELTATVSNSTGLTVSSQIRKGAPKSILPAEAASRGADCIFVGARGLSRFERFRLGSVSAATAARAHCSVEVVRPGGRAE